MIVTAVSLGAFSRASLPDAARQPFHLCVDEFQTFTTLSIVNMTAKLRKYGIGLVLAHQFMHQLGPDILHALLGNAGTLISFRLGAEDAAYVAREFQPQFTAEDFIRLPNHRVYLRLMINGEPSRPFSADTIGSTREIYFCENLSAVRSL